MTVIDRPASHGLRGRRWPRATADHGSVTAEFATVLPAVVVVVVLLVAALAWCLSAVRSQEAAGAVARALARGESSDAVEVLAARVLPRGARWTLERDDRFVRVRVDAPPIPGPMARVLPPLTVTARVPAEP